MWISRVIALVAVGCGAGCDSSPCAARERFAFPNAASCLACPLANQCGDARATLATVRMQGSCAAQFACAARCPERDEHTCGCEAGCLADTACRDAWTTWETCVVATCEPVCDTRPMVVVAVDASHE